jgi:hypothetical protein
MKRLALLLVLAACGGARDDAEQVARSAEREARSALGLASKVKSELDKVYRTRSDYDMTLDSDAHAEAIGTMTHVTVGDAVVGYEESSVLSLDGATYTKHFRATWRHDGRNIGVSYYTTEDLDAAAFADLLKKLVPIVERQL